MLNYLYYYDGGGVAAGDVSGDGRPDLYFTANEGPNQLFLNKGGLRFEEVTDAAGVAGTADWTTGTSMADVNGDGHLDLYVCTVSAALGLEGRNQLFINNGDGTFTEKAEAYGLDFAGYSTQAAFFDYDRDGDLDLYLLNHSTHDERTYGRSRLRYTTHPRAGDRLFRNDGGRFTDVTEAAGIYSSKIGYGLGVTVSDLNTDGWPDLYVANDFHENDYLYYNNGDGTFREAIETATGHTSLSSMGVDAADINGDARPDVAVLDMLPEREAVRKTTTSIQAYDVYRIKRRYGYQPQYTRNVLQLNEGQERFSEIGQLAGIEATDWSWAPLFADLDGDGWQDLFVTNGIYRRPNDLDYIDYTSKRSIQASLERGITEGDMKLLQRMPRGPAPNYAFRNNGDLTFTDRAEAWGLAEAGFSNGAAYADFDGDGDLDLVTNNVEAPASLYENRADRLTNHHFLTVRLVGARKNTAGIGAKVTVWSAGRRLFREQSPVRGFQSSVEPRLHFGLGAARVADSLTVVWPDGRSQTRTRVEAGQTVALHQREAAAPDTPAPSAPAKSAPAEGDGPEAPPLFTNVTGTLGLAYRHRENAFDDFSREPLMPHKVSTEGPALATADVNGDGLVDAYAGGAKHQPGRLLLQAPDGTFRADSTQAAFHADSLHEDVAAAFFDAEGDGDPDLYVVSAGNEFAGEAKALRDRLYLGDGTGRFTRAKGALPDHMFAQGACVTPADYDGDGDIDLFVGGRVVANNYGRTPRSYLLENNGRGRFTDVTKERAEGLARTGMVTSAAWSDTDGDGRLDLIVAGEWMPIRVYRQTEGGRLVERTAAAGLASSNGWWSALHAADLDGDGDEDLVAGNLGLNTKLEASPRQPARLWLADFDDSGSLDPILTYYRSEGTSYPMASQNALFQQIRTLKKKFPTYAAFGARRVEELFPEEKLEAADVKEAYTLATSYAENNGDGTFTLRRLPMRAQFAPVYGICASDFDGDGRPDLLLAGGFYGVKPVRGRYDASYGLLLRGLAPGEAPGRAGGASVEEGVPFKAVAPAASNLWLEGEIRALRRFQTANEGEVIVAARNNSRLQVIRTHAPSTLVSAADPRRSNTDWGRVSGRRTKR